MSVHVFRDADVFVGPLELTAQIRATQLVYSAEPKDITTLNSTTRTNTGGLKMFAFSHEGFWESGTTGSTSAFDDQRFDEIGTDGTVVSINAESSEAGRAYLMQSLFTEYTPRGAVGEPFGYNVSGGANTGVGVVRGRVLWNSTGVFESGSTGGTAVQLTDSSSTKTVYGALHVLTATSSGATGLTVRVESDNSSNFASPTTVFTFTATTGATAEWQSGSGSTDDWFRAINTASSSDSRFTLALSVGVSSN